jgi:hypothetical protein
MLFINRLITISMNLKKDMILELISTKGGSTSSEIHAMAGTSMSYATVK